MIENLETSGVLAQAPDMEMPSLPWLDQIIGSVGESLGTSVLDLIRAILILLVGWIIAGIVRKIINTLLKQTKIDNQIANWITGQEGGEAFPIEKWISELAYWLVILITVIASLEALSLEQVSQPLLAMVNNITDFLPQVGGALILLGLAWLLATIVKLIVTRALTTMRVDQRLGQQVGTEGEQFTLSETIANTLYWFIFLLFLPSILSTLELEGTLTPVQELLNKILDILPNVLAAVLIGVAGWLVAQVVRRVVTNLLIATGTDRLGARFSLSGQGEQKSLSWILGTVVYVLVLIPVAISALNALRIDAISEPAIAMLEQILSILPQIFTAGIILVVAYLGGAYVAELVTSLLTGIGFNNVYSWLGLSISSTSTPPTDTQGESTEGTESSSSPNRTPSEIVGIILQIGIVLVAALAAVDILKIPALTGFVSGIMVIGGQVLVALIVFGVGLYFANLAFNLINSSGGRQARILGHTARISIIILVSAMALQQMGIASNIVNLAFGLLVGAIAVAIALAFGLGGRDIAAEQIREWLNSFKQNN
ncbi:mechanosensitive ion channel [Spirulina sp. CS-785/01]|uniref:mechanosensitive ion channel n=1 Tax=Spirulina sp. CS-785/01 TaxID=3021716 RepID=UPI0023301214|nr:mechanosensitive ion channel [Spirulina sp. CS-785/01]MDB9312676.1 mechanosensitive ion channel [Spirulina sp. CS-785/01]